MKQNRMGLFQSTLSQKEDATVECLHEVLYEPRNDEITVALDKQAFDLHVTGSSKTVRVTKLHVNGRWAASDNVYGPEPYEDEYVRITPVNGKATLQIIKKPVQYLYLSPSSRTRSILCHRGNMPVVYMSLTLKKQPIEDSKRRYDISDNSFILCGNEYILLVNVPSASEAKPNAPLPESSSKLDPSLMFFATAPLRHDF